MKETAITILIVHEIVHEIEVALSHWIKWQVKSACVNKCYQTGARNLCTFSVATSILYENSLNVLSIVLFFIGMSYS